MFDFVVDSILRFVEFLNLIYVCMVVRVNSWKVNYFWKINYRLMNDVGGFLVIIM